MVLIRHLGYGARVRGDILEDFIASPLNRTKDALPNLMVLVGWEYGTGVSTAPASAERYMTAFVEELWRRNLGTAYHATPAQMANDMLERLLLESDGGEENAAGEDGAERHANKPQKEREFEEYAKFKFGKLSKAKQAEAAKIWTSKGPEIEVRRLCIQRWLHLTSIDYSLTDSIVTLNITYIRTLQGLLPENHGFKSCKLLKYSDHAARLDKIVAEELGKIKTANEYVAALYNQRPLGAGFSGKMKVCCRLCC